MRKRMVAGMFALMILFALTTAITIMSNRDGAEARKKSYKVKKIRLVTSKNDEVKAVYLSDKIKKIKVTYSKKNVIVKGKIDKRGNFKYQVKKSVFSSRSRRGMQNSGQHLTPNPRAV